MLLITFLSSCYCFSLISLEKAFQTLSRNKGQWAGRSASSRHEKSHPKVALILSCRRTIRTVPTRTDGFGLRQLLWLSDSTYPLLSKYFHPLFCRTSRRSRARLIFVVNRALIKVSFQNIRLSFNKSFCLIKQF